MSLKRLLNKLKPKRKLKFNIDEKLMIGRELGNIIDFRTKHTEYRWRAIYEYFKSINYKATMDEVTEYFMFGHFTRYEIVDLTTSDSITFRVLEDLSKNTNSTLHIVEAFDHEVDTIADNLQYYIGDKYKAENLHNGSIRVSKIKIKGDMTNEQ